MYYYYYYYLLGPGHTRLFDWSNVSTHFHPVHSLFSQAEIWQDLDVLTGWKWHARESLYTRAHGYGLSLIQWLGCWAGHERMCNESLVCHLLTSWIHKYPESSLRGPLSWRSKIAPKCSEIGCCQAKIAKHDPQMRSLLLLSISSARGPSCFVWYMVYFSYAGAFKKTCGAKCDWATEKCPLT